MHNTANKNTIYHDKYYNYNKLKIKIKHHKPKYTNLKCTYFMSLRTVIRGVQNFCIE